MKKENKFLKRKLDNGGFSLIELLAVIVIMGILMIVAIPAMTRYIDNSRKDTYVNIGLSFIKAARYAVLQDEYTCGGNSSGALGDGTYYIEVAGANADDELMENEPKSPFGSGSIDNGYVLIRVDNGKSYYGVHLSTGDWTLGKNHQITLEDGTNENVLGLESAITRNDASSTENYVAPLASYTKCSR